MKLYLFDKPKFQQLYNCTFYNIDRILPEQRVHVFWGYFFLVVSVLFTILYVPCIYAMLVSDWRHKTSYKLMIELGFIQLVGLQICGLYISTQAIHGTVFCSSPDFQYVSSCLIFFHWLAASSCCDILGINRICELYSTELAEKLFGGWKFYIWAIFPVLYGVLMAWFTTPIFFSSTMFAFFSNPHSGYFDDPQNTYLNPMLPIHNISVCLTELITYITLPILYFRAVKCASDEFRSRIRYERQIFFQVICIGLINFSASLTYIVIQLVPISFTTTLSGTIGYLLSQGMASVVYLVVNRSIRHTILLTLGFRPGRINNSSTFNLRQQVRRTPSTIVITHTNVSQEAQILNVSENPELRRSTINVQI